MNPTLLVFALFAVVAVVHSEVHLDKLKLQPGWKIEQLAEVPNARQMSVNKEETVLFIGNKDGGTIYAVPLTYDAANSKYNAGMLMLI
jgi:hypothetical protein